MYGIELAIIILGTFSCALVSSSPSISSSALLIFWRVLMVSPLFSRFCTQHTLSSMAQADADGAQGIGIGGDYPLSSVITSE